MLYPPPILFYRCRRYCLFYVEAINRSILHFFNRSMKLELMITNFVQEIHWHTSGMVNSSQESHSNACLYTYTIHRKIVHFEEHGALTKVSKLGSSDFYFRNIEISMEISPHDYYSTNRTYFFQNDDVHVSVQHN